MALNGKKRKRLNNHSRPKVCENVEEDISVMGQSIETSIRGVRQLIRAVSEADPQFQDLLFNECVLIYECKVCQNLFRSLANFIKHKTKYCTKRFSFCSTDIFSDNAGRGFGSRRADQTTISSSGAQPLIVELTPEVNNAVFQTLVPNETENSGSLKESLYQLEETSEVVILKDGTAVLSQEGRIINELACTKCSQKFANSRALANHVQLSHEKRTCFSCPLCQMFLASPYSVYRHLRKVHQKSEDQIRRLRSSVLKKAVDRELYEPDADASNERVTHPNPTPNSEEEKWYAQFENKFAACKICGKDFSRRAVLDVHVKTCKLGSTALPTAKENREQRCCSKCGKQFGRRATYNSHVFLCKGLASSNACNRCGRTFTVPRSLSRHKRRCIVPAGRSPLRHLMSPPRCSPKMPLPTSPSVIIVRRDYNKPPTPTKSTSATLQVTERSALNLSESVSRRTPIISIPTQTVNSCIALKNVSPVMADFNIITASPPSPASAPSPPPSPDSTSSQCHGARENGKVLKETYLNSSISPRSKVTLSEEVLLNGEQSSQFNLLVLDRSSDDLTDGMPKNSEIPDENENVEGSHRLDDVADESSWISLSKTILVPVTPLQSEELSIKSSPSPSASIDTSRSPAHAKDISQVCDSPKNDSEDELELLEDGDFEGFEPIDLIESSYDTQFAVALEQIGRLCSLKDISSSSSSP